MLKNIPLYYILILVPLAFVVNIGRFASDIFFILLLCYAFIYHPTITGLRLIHLGVIDKKDLWKIYIIPFWYTKYFSIIFFNYHKK